MLNCDVGTAQSYYLAHLVVNYLLEKETTLFRVHPLVLRYSSTGCARQCYFETSGARSLYKG